MKLFYFQQSFLPILSEGKIENLKLKYPKFEKEIDTLSLKDTTSSKKTLDWAVKWLVSGQALVNEIGDVIQLFIKFNDRLNQDERDIDHWKSFTELRNRLFELKNTKSKTAQKNDVKTAGANKIYEDEQVILILIKNKNASCMYGAGTQWCITMQNEIYYEDYDAKNTIILFVLRKDLDQTNPFYKVAVVHERDFDNNITEIQFFDAEDTQYDSYEEPLSDVKNISKILKIAEKTAAAQPKSNIAKYASKEITIDQIPESEKTDQFWTWVLLNNYQEEKIPENVLAKLADNEEAEIRELVAQETESEDILEKLSNDVDMQIRMYVAQNKNTPFEILEILKDDNDELVRRQAIKFINYRSF